MSTNINNPYNIAGKPVQGGIPADLQIIRFNFANNQWEFVAAPAGEANTGVNVGAGTGLVFRNKIGVALNFKSLLQGANMTITDNADDITIATLAEINLAANVGAGPGFIFRDKTGVTLNMKSLVNGANITITDNADDITISGPTPGEINLMANVGIGAGLVFRDKIAVTFNLKSLLAGANITLTNNVDDITIAASATAVTTNRLTDDIVGDFTTTSTSYVDTGLQITLSNQAGGSAMVTAFFGQFNSGGSNRFALADDGVNQTTVNISVTTIPRPCTPAWSFATDGSVIDVRARVSAGTMTINATDGEIMQAMEIF